MRRLDWPTDATRRFRSQLREVRVWANTFSGVKVKTGVLKSSPSRRSHQLHTAQRSLDGRNDSGSLMSLYWAAP